MEINESTQIACLKDIESVEKTSLENKIAVYQGCKVVRRVTA